MHGSVLSELISETCSVHPGVSSSYISCPAKTTRIAPSKLPCSFRSWRSRRRCARTGARPRSRATKIKVCPRRSSGRRSSLPMGPTRLLKPRQWEYQASKVIQSTAFPNSMALWFQRKTTSRRERTGRSKNCGHRNHRSMMVPLRNRTGAPQGFELVCAPAQTHANYLRSLERAQFSVLVPHTRSLSTGG